MSKTAAKQAIESISNSSSTATTSIIPALVEDHSDSSSVSSSTDDEDDDDDDDDEDDEDEEDEEEVELRRKMQALLQKAKLSARAKAAAVKVDELKDQTEIVLFGDEGADSDDEGTSSNTATKTTQIAHSLVRPVHVAAPKLTALDKGKGREITLGQDLAGLVGAESRAKGDSWGQAPLQSMSKKERKAKQTPTAGPKWFNMPAQVLTPELKREVQAMRLRNALDPKRFYKGGAKNDKSMPEFFQLGHIMPSTTSASTAPASIPRKRTFVEELVDDEQAKAYTKKKFVNEVMARGMSGRGRSKKGGREKGRGGKGRS